MLQTIVAAVPVRLMKRDLLFIAEQNVAQCSPICLGMLPGRRRMRSST
jgi:hypothetical protein